MTDLDRYLSHELAERARRVEFPPADLDAVITRSHRRRRRQRVVSSLVVVVGLLTGVVGVERTRRPQPEIAISAGVSSVQRGDTGIRWRRTDTVSGLGFAQSLTAGGTLYALSTAPGQANPEAQEGRPPVLYRSTDGVSWSPVANDSAGLYLSDLSARDDRLYAVATGPATARTAMGTPVSDLLATWSDDGAATWHRVKLPLDLSAIAGKTTRLWVGPSKVAAGAQGVLAVTTIGGELDLLSFLPPGVTAPDGWAVTDTGVDLLGPGPECPAGSTTEPKGESGTRRVPATPPGEDPRRPRQLQTTYCYTDEKSPPKEVSPQSTHGVIRSFTWDELGVGGDLLAVLRGVPMAFLSSDGTSFERVELPLDSAANVDVAADDEGFTVVTTVLSPTKLSARPAVLRSNDGHRWEPVPAPPGVASTVGRLDDRVAVLLGEPASRLSILGPGGWTTARLRDALDPALVEKSSVSLMSAGIGPLGAAAVVTVMDDPIAQAGGVRVTDNGYTLHILNHEWAAVVTDKEGVEVARVDSLMTALHDGALRLDPRASVATLVDPASGKALARFEFQEKTGPLYSKREAPASAAYVLFSRDGETWSSQPLAELVGRPVTMVTNVTVTDSDVLISIPEVKPGAREPGPVTVLRGTL